MHICSTEAAAARNNYLIIGAVYLLTYLLTCPCVRSLKVLPSLRYRSSAARLSLPGLGFSAGLGGDGGSTAGFFRRGGGAGSRVLVDATDDAAGVVVVCDASGLGDGARRAVIIIIIIMIMIIIFNALIRG